MIGPFDAGKVMIATKTVDFRKDAEALAALLKAEMGADPFSGTIYLFRPQANRLKSMPSTSVTRRARLPAGRAKITSL